MILSTISVMMTNLNQSILIMIQGMLGIFAFMAMFYLLVYLMDKFFNPKEQK
ncbi:MAG: OadG-related small transporter subunit [Candidatus Cloacimonadaceae bacterium]|nr:OadG-related small transporter subunit [Candidatus Cloacimonadaceae bacterium]